MNENVRKRFQKSKATAKAADEYNVERRNLKYSNKHTEFLLRESPLTELLESSLHIRAIYHIFVVILLVLLCDTVIYDLVERGKINIGLNVVSYGFGDIRRGAKLWLFDLTVALAFYPVLVLYAWTGSFSRKYTGLRPLIPALGTLGLVGVQLMILFPAWDLSREHLALGSSVAVTLEMFRFMMKIHAVAVACAPQCLVGKTPLPTFKHYVYYLFAPTLIYRDEYPRTKKIRWDVVVFHFVEVAAIIFYVSFLWERFILPYWSNYGKQNWVEAGAVVRGMFACILPGMLSFFCGFYCVLHAWQNAFAEMLTFGDRLFYEDWWTASNFSRYYRYWNRVVYSWLRQHVYHPLAPILGNIISTFAVFIISSIAHEVVLALSFGFFYPVLLVQFGVIGAMLVPLTASTGRRFPNAFNIMMWLSFFIGNGLLWSLYPMEYFARKNCPPSENDNFFIPKSWSCPKIVLKANWTFQNPFEMVY